MPAIGDPRSRPDGGAHRDPHSAWLTPATRGSTWCPCQEVWIHCLSRSSWARNCASSCSACSRQRVFCAAYRARSFVRDVTSASRELHKVLHARACSLGMCTNLSSTRHDTSLSTCASRRSVLIPRAPTPRLGARVAGTTLTPARWTAPGMDVRAQSRPRGRAGPRSVATAPGGDPPRTALTALTALTLLDGLRQA